MRIDEIRNVDRELLRRLPIGIMELVHNGLVSGVHHNDGLRISVHDHNAVELLLRYIGPSSPPPVDSVVSTLALAGLRVESNCDRGWNRDQSQPGSRWVVAYEVTADPVLDPGVVDVDQDTIDGVYCYDVRR